MSGLASRHELEAFPELESEYEGEGEGEFESEEEFFVDLANLAQKANPIPKLADLGNKAGRAALRGIENVGSAASQFGRSVGRAGRGVGQGIGSAGQGIAQGVGNAARGVGQGVGNVAQGMGQGAGAVWQGVGRGVGGYAAGVGRGIGSAGVGVGQGAGAAAAGIGHGIGVARQGINQGMAWGAAPGMGWGAPGMGYPNYGSTYGLPQPANPCMACLPCLNYVMHNMMGGMVNFPQYESEGEPEWEANNASQAAAALMEHLAHAAANAESEAEAEAFIGALVPLAAQLAPRVAPILMNAAPQLVKGLAGVAKTLHRDPNTRALVRTLPTIVRRTAVAIGRQAAQGRAVTPQNAVRTLARQTSRVISNPRQSVQAWQQSKALDQQYHQTAATPNTQACGCQSTGANSQVRDFDAVLRGSN